MTLALYGKSRRRQGSLLLAALLAIIAASVGGLAIISSAFAHNTAYTKDATCTDWSAKMVYANGGGEGVSAGDRRLILIHDVQLNGNAFVASWANSNADPAPNDSGDGGTPAGTNGVIARASYATTAGLPAASANDFVWVGNTGDFTIFDQTGALPLNANWGGTASVWAWSAAQSKWIDQGYTSTVTAPTPGTNCTKIIVKKTVTGTTPPATSFPITIDDLGLSGSSNYTGNIAVGSNYEQNLSGIAGSDGSGDNDDFTVTEGSSGVAGWTTVGWAIIASTDTCDNDVNGSSSGDGFTAGSTASGGDLNNIDPGETVVVCFKNEYTAPPADPTVSKVAHSTPIAGGYAFWDIKIDQPSSGAVAINGLVIVDSKGDILIDSVTGAGASCNLTAPPAGEITCNIGTADATIVVKRPINASTLATGTLCLGGTIVNGITSAAMPTGAAITITGTNPVSINVPADNTACTGTVSIVKSDAVKDGSLLKWTITLQNTYAIAKHIIVYDPNSSLVAATETGCTGTLAEAPDDYYDCEVGANSSATFQVSTPYPGHANICQPLDVNNTAYIATSTTSQSTGNLGSDGGTYHEDAGQSASCVNIDKANATKVGSTLQWVVTLTNTSGVAQTVAVFDANSTLVGYTGCTNSVSENPTDTYSCTVPANNIATITLSTPYGGSGSVCDGYQTSNTAYITGQQNKSDTAQYSDTAQGGASCITVTKVKTATSNPPTWTVSIVNTAAIAQNVYVQDTDATLAQVVSGGSCTSGDDIMGNGVQCTVNANSTLVLTVTKAYPAAATCEGTDVSNTVNVWVGTFASTPATAPDKTADGGTFDNLNANPSLCSHTVKVCKIVVGNGDGIVDGGQFRFGSNPSNNTVLLSSQTTEPAGDAVDGAQGTKNCVDLIVANTDTTIFEWGYRPGDNGLTGTWNGDAAGFPRSGATSTNSCDLQTNGTVAINSQTTEVTFCNKTNPRTEKILITKNFTGLNGYVPVAGDVPSFTLTPSTNTSCAAPFQQDNDTWTIECTVPAGWSAGGGTVKETPKPNWNVCPAVEETSLVQQLSGLVSEVMSVVAVELLPQYANTFTFCNYPVGKIIVIKDDETSPTNPDRPASWLFTVNGPNVSVQAPIPLGGGQFSIVDVALANGYSADETNGHFNVAEFCSAVSNPTGAGYQSVNQTPGAQDITYPGQEITFRFKNGDCGQVLGTGHLDIWKVRDLNGNGVQDGGDSNIAWTVTVQGPEFPGGQVLNVPAGGLHLDGLTEGVYTITEGSQFGYALVGVTSNENPGLSASTSTQIDLHNDETDTVTFFNKPFGQIPVHKNAFTSHNGGANVAAPNDDDGWTITLTSAQCGINQVKVTDNNGDALFTGLPLCNDYVVSEGAVNASSPGFVPLTASQFTNITPNGVTLTFNNILRTQDPPCINCGPTTTPTPVTPTATPPTSTVVPPTNTPVPPTATPTQPSPVSTQAGERTPGPGQTPIAPSTGGGVLGGTTGGFNLLLIVAGLLALTSGVSFLALGRKNRR